MNRATAIASTVFVVATGAAGGVAAADPVSSSVPSVSSSSTTWPAWAAPARFTRPTLALEATFDPATRRIAGTAHWVIPNPGPQALAEVRFWLYPNRLRSRPDVLGDVNFHWLYPRGFSPAAMHVAGARANNTPLPVTLESSAAGPDTVARVGLPFAVAPESSIAVDVDFTTDLPVRLGSFGCDAGQCRAMGGFYPSPLALGAGGFDRDAPPPRIDFTARVLAPPGGALLLGDVHDAGAGVAILASGIDAPYVTLVAGPGLDLDRAATSTRQVSFFHAGPRPPPSAAHVLPYVREDRAGLVLDGARQALDFLAIAAPTLAGVGPRAPIVLLEAPLRHQLVHVHGNVVQVSDRIFEIFPLERLRKFHRLELIRAVVTAALDEPLRAVEPDGDVDLAAEVLALHLTAAFALQEFHRLEFAGDLLRPLSFIPAVDQLIYAPLVASSSSYFGDVGDRDAIRDDVRAFSHQRAGGRLLHAKLLDLLHPAGMQRLMEIMLRERLPLRQAAARVFGAPLDWFWRQWLAGSPPRVNYRLARVRCAPLAGQAAPAVHVDVDVRREGADLTEPVEVRVGDRAGGAHDLIWAAPGTEHSFEVDLPAGLSFVEIDPRHRLVESAVGSLDSTDDPLTDNRQPRSWRFLYSGAAALLDVTARDLSFAAAVRVKPRHDLRNSVLLLANHAPSTTIGVEGAYARLFGRQADRNRLTSDWGASLSASVLNRDFGVSGAETLHPAWKLSGSLFAEHDDRDYFIDPWRAVGMTAALSYALTGLDDGQRLSQVGAGVELLRLFELAPGHVLAVDGQAGATWGDLRVRAQLAQIGGATGLRGYAPGELFGRGRALGRVELRDRYVSDLDWNLLHLTSVRGLGGNLFFEAGAVTSCDDLSVGRNDVFYDVGYSFRVLHDAFGVYQQLLSLDVAIPLNRHDRVCLGQHVLSVPGVPQPRRPPFVVLISFLPNF